MWEEFWVSWMCSSCNWLKNSQVNPKHVFIQKTSMNTQHLTKGQRHTFIDVQMLPSFLIALKQLAGILDGNSLIFRCYINFLRVYFNAGFSN
ncbi:hypothetical protein OUZ56_012775 [Daphnia magna]|uniref:Uncharacterized protein n=1 Tax=Daphnia magna TaxID=35525 RepID=A0ABQ9Z413_9CRUS|nr:hypothetical protein OUZ56_012775 [Daphnia magna]